MVERGPADPPARQPAADASALVEHQHPATGALEFGGRGQPGHSGADDQHVGRLSRFLRHFRKILLHTGRAAWVASVIRSQSSRISTLASARRGRAGFPSRRECCLGGAPACRRFD